MFYVLLCGLCASAFGVFSALDGCIIGGAPPDSRIVAALLVYLALQSCAGFLLAEPHRIPKAGYLPGLAGLMLVPAAGFIGYKTGQPQLISLGLAFLPVCGNYMAYAYDYSTVSGLPAGMKKKEQPAERPYYPDRERMLAAIVCFENIEKLEAVKNSEELSGKAAACRKLLGAALAKGIVFPASATSLTGELMESAAGTIRLSGPGEAGREALEHLGGVIRTAERTYRSIVEKRLGEDNLELGVTADVQRRIFQDSGDPDGRARDRR